MKLFASVVFLTLALLAECKKSKKDSKSSDDFKETEIREYTNGECEICSKQNKFRPKSLTLEYIGGQGAISKYQDADKASCRDQDFPAQDTTVSAYGVNYAVSPGTVFTIVPDGDKMDAETDFGFTNGSECYIHTSCSVPLVAGDHIGPFLVLEGNQCIFTPPTPAPTRAPSPAPTPAPSPAPTPAPSPQPSAEPTPCICRATGSYENGKVNIEFDLCGAETKEYDWIGVYPCDAETLMADDNWDAGVPYENVFEVGYVKGEVYVNQEPIWFTYICGSPGDNCQQKDDMEWPSSGTLVLDPAQSANAPWAFRGGGTSLKPGCYKTHINHESVISAPPYPTVCQQWAEAPEFYVE